MSQAAIESLLQQKIGLEAKAIGSKTISRAVNERLVDCNLSSLNAYLTRLQTSDQELEALIESVVVPETWFFRDRESFAFLRQYVKSEWQPRHPDGVLRVLSVPCSTGEEPYSIAIAFLEAGLSPKQFSIDAVDVSKNAIRQAKRAIYKQHSFRGNTHDLPKHYFTQIGTHYELCETIRSTVNFFQGNLLEPKFLFEIAPYDVIFCRNLLIYFTPSARKHTIQVLEHLLTQEGLLFVGHSETIQISTYFTPVTHPSAFAFRKAAKQVPNIAITNFPKFLTSPSAKTKTSINPQPSVRKSNPLTTPQPSVVSENQQPSLEAARVFANQGELNQAATLCETYLSQNRTSAEAYFLLGQVRQAAGNQAQALEYFQKAIYLKPDYYEALIHLALLKEHQGDFKGSLLIRQRIQRLLKN